MIEDSHAPEEFPAGQVGQQMHVQRLWCDVLSVGVGEGVPRQGLVGVTGQSQQECQHIQEPRGTQLTAAGHWQEPG